MNKKIMIYRSKNCINLDITHRCPLLCGSCMRQSNAYKQSQHLYKDMALSDYKKIIDAKFEFIEFCGQQSDPMTHPDILEFISLSYNTFLTIQTATSHKDKDFYEEAFSRCGMKTTWIFGLDGLPEESHKHRINQNGVHLYEMMKLGSSMGIDIRWQYIVFNYNQDHIDEAQKMAENDNIKFTLAFSNRWGNSKMKSLKPSEKYCA